MVMVWVPVSKRAIKLLSPSVAKVLRQTVQPHPLPFFSVKQKNFEVQVGRDGKGGTEGESNSVQLISHFWSLSCSSTKSTMLYMKLCLAARSSLLTQSILALGFPWLSSHSMLPFTWRPRACCPNVVTYPFLCQPRGE